MDGCHENATDEWNISTALSSADATSQTHTVHGDSSSRVASRSDEASKAAREQPTRKSAALLTFDAALSGEKV